MKDRYDFLDTLNRYFNVNLVMGICSVLTILNVDAITGIAGIVALVCSILSLIYTWRLYKTSANKKMRTVFWLQLGTAIVIFIMAFALMSVVMSLVFQESMMSGYGHGSLDSVENYLDMNPGIILIIIAFAIILLVIRIITIVLSLSFFKEEVPTEKVNGIYNTVLTLSIIAVVIDVIFSAFMNSQSSLNVSSILSTVVYLYFLNICRNEYQILLEDEDARRYTDFE